MLVPIEVDHEILPTHLRVLITGAAGAIGASLAREYAAPGVELHLHARRLDALTTLAADCRSVGAEVICHGLDLSDCEKTRLWFETLHAEFPVDLLILNAGVNTDIGPHGDGESWDDVLRLIDVNVRSTIALAHAAVPGMRRRRHGQIVLISSLAAYFGLPVTPSYCASKAAVKAYGEALRGWLQPFGIRVNVVMPGYVSSAMCDAMPGPKPFLWQPEKAACYIRRGLERNQARISFPFPLNLGAWFLAALPASVSQWIVNMLGYRGDTAR